MNGKQQQVLDCAITVRNQSPNKSYYVVSELRKILYNPTTYTLFLGLSDEPQNQDDPIHPPFIPKVIAIPAETLAVLQITLPLIFRQPKLPVSFPPAYEFFDLSQAKHIKCSIAFNDVPPLEEQPNTANVEVRYSLPWVQNSEAEFELT